RGRRPGLTSPSPPELGDQAEDEDVHSDRGVLVERGALGRLLTGHAVHPTQIIRRNIHAAQLIRGALPARGTQGTEDLAELLTGGIRQLELVPAGDRQGDLRALTQVGSLVADA